MLRSTILLGSAAVLAALFVAACSDAPAASGVGGQGAGGDATSVGGAGGAGGAGGGGGAVIPASHPRIYLNEANRTRLTAALSGEEKAAARFRDMVDGHMANGNVYAFEAHFAALLG